MNVFTTIATWLTLVLVIDVFVRVRRLERELLPDSTSKASRLLSFILITVAVALLIGALAGPFFLPG